MLIVHLRAMNRSNIHNTSTRCGWSGDTAAIRRLNVPAFVFLESGFDLGDEFGGAEDLIGAATGPIANEAEDVFVAVPVGNLFDGGLFEIAWESGLAGAGSVSGQNVASRISDPANAE